MGHLNRNKAIVFILLLLMVLPVYTYGGTTGKLVGKVIDAQTNEPLPGVNIILQNTSFGAATDLDGHFLIIGIPPGEYAVQAMMIGYQEVVVTNVKVNADKTTKVDFELKEKSLELEEAIEVTARRKMVKRDLTSTESSVDRDAIENLPVENFTDVVNLQAGVVNGHFRGGRLGEVAYMIDGVPVNDVYSGSYAIQVENNSIQELNVISGTFNAEYGQAMSGVVNVITREGTQKYSGNATLYMGDYISGHDDIFWNIGSVNPISNFQGNLSGGVPGFANRLKFYLSSRIFHDDGYIYGKKVFTPSDHSDFTQESPENWVVESRGQTYSFSEALAQRLIDEAKAEPMNATDRYTGTLKLTFRPTDTDKISVQGIYQVEEWQNYNHQFRLNPEGTYQNQQNGITSIAHWNHVFSPRTFLDLRYSYFDTQFEQYVYENRFDDRYVSSRRLQDTGANAFLSGGQQMWQFRRNTTTQIIKPDLTSQINNTHQIKAGLELKFHRLWLHEYEVLPDDPDRISPLTAFNNNQYTHYPVELAAYAQDKIELDYMVVNAGLRLDFFDPDGQIPQNFKKPSDSERKAAETSFQISPRIGIAYPVSETGVIHVSYGHFFQTPNFFYLYTNPEFDILQVQSTPSPPPQSLINTVGNANLDPQKTVIYELGLQQQIGSNFAITLTAFYKDIRNLLGTQVLQNTQGIRYARYINRDYGFVRGITFEFEKRYSNFVSANIDYTYQIAKGNASDPNNAFLDAQTDPPKETEKQLVPLDWDRRHQINTTLTLGKPGNYALSLIGQYGTGLPYTPTFQNIQTSFENSVRKPDQFNVDLYAYKDFQWGGLTYSFFVRAFNLFDRLNEQNVFTDTGRAGYTLAPLYVGGLRPRGLNTLEQYFIRPDFYSAPRRVQIGVEMEF
ncbi:MAG: TonB-dependent receptor plug domain-containing protein [Caldithrix sp.]|nr:TonB-dependent receptor plug domain-containing protein [Caldithrix sp.]